MKKLLYVLPIVLFLNSCTDSTISNENDNSQKYVYGIDRYLADGAFVESIGSMSYNYSGSIETVKMNIYPNPAMDELFISFDVSRGVYYKITLETALGDDDFLKALVTNREPIVSDLPILNYYQKVTLHEGFAKVGSNLLQINLVNKSPGVYYIIYEDSDGIKKFIPFVKDRSRISR